MFCGVHGHMATFKDSDELHVIAKVVHRSNNAYKDGVSAITPTYETVIGTFPRLADGTPDYRFGGLYRFWIPLVAQGRKAVKQLESVNAMGTLRHPMQHTDALAFYAIQCMLMCALLMT